MKQNRVLLVDDHTLVREGIRALLEEIEGIQIVGEAGDGVQALQLIAEHKPDIVLLDLAMPKLGGLEVLRRAEKSFPAVKFIVLTAHERDDYAIDALRAGALGFVPKSAAIDELQTAIETVEGGEKYISPRVSQQSILRGAKQQGGRPPKGLTPRQSQVLEMIAMGRTTRQIAKLLGITVKTVEAHRAQIMDRLDIHDVAGLVRYAIRTGLLPMED